MELRPSHGLLFHNPGQGRFADHPPGIVIYVSRNTTGGSAGLAVWSVKVVAGETATRHTAIQAAYRAQPHPLRKLPDN